MLSLKMSKQKTAIEELWFLINLTSASFFEFMKDCASFEAATEVLNNLFF